jgi:cytochrome c-type biogenesis protein CcmF
MVLWRIGRGNPRMAGGALTHVGFAIMVLGIVASSGFSRALPRLGELSYANEEKQSRQNFVLARGETRNVNGYRVTYRGTEENNRGRNKYLLDVTDPRGRSYQLSPIAYQGQGDQWFMHPDVKAFVEKDIYAAVTPKEATGAGQEKGPPGGEFQLAQGDSTVLGGDRFAVSFRGFDVLKGPQEGMPDQAQSDRVPDGAMMAVGARLNVTNLKTQETRSLRPIYLVMKDNSQQYVENRVADWDLRMAFTQMDVNSGKATFAVEGVDVMPDDWVVVQAYAKPMISLLWLGIIIMTFGFVVAIIRRVGDIRHQR